MNILNFSFERFSTIIICSALIGIAVSYSDLYLYHVFLSFFIFLFFLKKYSFYKKGKKVEIQLSKILSPFLICFVWYFTTLIWSDNILYSLKYLFYLFCGMSIVILLVQYSSSIDSFNRLFKSISIIIIIELIVSLLESFSKFQMPISRYSKLSTFFGKEMQEVHSSDILLSIISSPPTGFHWDTNELALTMMLAAPFFLCLDRTIVKSLGFISIFIIIIMTASRAVFFGLLMISLFYLFAIKKKIKSLFLIVSSIVLIVLAMLALVDSENPNLNELANTVNTAIMYLSGDIDINGSLMWRRELVDNGINALVKSKGLGLAAGGSVHMQEKLGGVDGRFTSMHNFWIELLVEGGVIFFTTFIIWLSWVIIKLYTIARFSKNKNIKYYSSSLFLAVIGFLPGAISSSSTIYYFPMWVLFGLSLTIIKIQSNLKY